MKKEILATLLALTACLIWSGNFVIAREVRDWMPSITLAFWRWLIASMIIIPIGYTQVKKHWHIIKKNWKYFVFMGVCGVGCFNSLVYISANTVSANNISIMLSTSPLWTALAAIVFGLCKMSLLKIFGVLLALAGTIVAKAEVAMSNGRLEYGYISLTGAVIVWTAFSFMQHYKPKEINALCFITVVIPIGTLFILPFYIWEAATISSTPFTAEAWSVYFYTGVLASVFAWSAWSYSIHTIGPVKTMFLYYSIPVFSGVLAITILNEELLHSHVYGFFLILLGVIVAHIPEIIMIRRNPAMERRRFVRPETDRRWFIRKKDSS